MKKKVVVRYAKVVMLDFGLLNIDYKASEIKVDAESWSEYCDKRLEFERMHSKLIDKVPKRKLERLLRGREKE